MMPTSAVRRLRLTFLRALRENGDALALPKGEKSDERKAKERTKVLKEISRKSETHRGGRAGMVRKALIVNRKH